jgi:hypothetical protein
MVKSKAVWKVPKGYKILLGGNFIPARCLISFGGLESFTTEDFRTRNSNIPTIEQGRAIGPLGFAQRYADYMKADFYEIINQPIHQPFKWEDDLKIQLYVINPNIKFSAEQEI